MIAQCCGISIDFAYMDGRTAPMPIERGSADVPGGNLAVWRDGEGQLRYRVLAATEEPAPGEHRAVSHFARCQQAARWRRRGHGGK